MIRVANEINRDLADKNPLFLSVLNGSFMFTADLLKHITIPCEISFVKLASYQGVTSTGVIKEIELNADTLTYVYRRRYCVDKGYAATAQHWYA